MKPGYILTTRHWGIYFVASTNDLGFNIIGTGMFLSGWWMNNDSDFFDIYTDIFEEE